MFFKHALVYMWMTFSMSYKIMKTEWYKLNIGNKKIIYRKTVDGLFLYLFEKEEKQCEVSGVLVLNKNGEISCYYVDENYPQYLSGFICINISGAPTIFFPVFSSCSNRR